MHAVEKHVDMCGTLTVQRNKYEEAKNGLMMRPPVAQVMFGPVLLWSHTAMELHPQTQSDMLAMQCTRHRAACVFTTKFCVQQLLHALCPYPLHLVIQSIPALTICLNSCSCMS